MHDKKPLRDSAILVNTLTLYQTIHANFPISSGQAKQNAAFILPQMIRASEDARRAGGPSASFLP